MNAFGARLLECCPFKLTGFGDLHAVVHNVISDLHMELHILIGSQEYTCFVEEFDFQHSVGFYDLSCALKCGYADIMYTSQCGEILSFLSLIYGSKFECISMILPLKEYEPHGFLLQPVYTWLPPQEIAMIGNGVVVKQSTIHGAGRGLFACGRIFKPGQLITEYCGNRLFDKITAAQLDVQTHILRVSASFHNHLGNDVYIDGDRDPMDGRGGGSFANHLSKALCNADFKMVDGKVYLVATKEVLDGSEIYVFCGMNVDVMMGKKRRRVCTTVDGKATVETVSILL